MSDSDVQVYKVGLCMASACAPSDMSGGDVAREVNLQHPTGISSPWDLSEETFATGEPNPCPCNQTPGRHHWLLEC